MKLVPMLELLKPALADGYAVPSFCVWNAETATLVLQVASDMKAPVILMNGPAEFSLVPPATLGWVIQGAVERCSVPAALHLDHGDSLERVSQCLAAGYTSVMLDYSARSYAENVQALRRVVALARLRGITVEGEIGHVGKVDAMTVEGAVASTLTSPAEAATYVAETGVDALAVSIGNAHGQYTRLPRLDFERLAQIRAVVSIPLVLHGGSGTPEADLRHAISLGIAKINVATDLITAVRESLRTQWNAGRNAWLPLAQAEALQALAPVVEMWIRRTGAAGRA